MIATSARDEAAISARAHALANVVLTIYPETNDDLPLNTADRSIHAPDYVHLR